MELEVEEGKKDGGRGGDGGMSNGGEGEVEE